MKRLALILSLLLALPAYAVDSVWIDRDNVTTSAEISTIAATPAQGAKADTALQPGDIGITVQGYSAGTVTAITDSTSTTSSTTAASATAVKAAKDAADAKQSPATTLAGYGITDGVKSTGVSGGQSITGGTAFQNGLSLVSTSDSSKGFINFDSTGHFYGQYGQLFIATNPALASVFPSSRIHLVGENTTGADDAGIRQDMYSTSSAFGSVAQFRARGSYASPLKVLSGDRLGGVAARGYYGVAGSGGGFAGSGLAAIFFDAAEDFNDSTHLGSIIRLETTPTASGTRSEAVRVGSDGNLTMQRGAVVESYATGTGTAITIDATKAVTRYTPTAATAVTLPKTLPAGSTSLRISIQQGATPYAVTWEVESGGTIGWGDAGAPATGAANKRNHVVCFSDNASATTTAAWDCAEAGRGF